MSRQPGDLRQDRPNGRPPAPEQNWRWAVILVFGLIVAALLLQDVRGSKPAANLSFNQVMAEVDAGHVKSAEFNNDTGRLTGELADGRRFSVTGPHPLLQGDRDRLGKVKDLKFTNSTPGLLGAVLPFLLPMLLLIGFYVWMSRRAQGQMTGLMSIGRSKAKVYTTERPKTTFADVAGYTGV
ncbi:MAG TPA: hypothetical protein VGO92_11510, partial [Acidimicrobiales bacterium]|nr:hypothetical protein [Acidimicrobiales bacterium]